MEWFSKNWWVVLILGLAAVGLWWYFSKEEEPIVTAPSGPCAGHEGIIKEQIDFINNDADWKANAEKQINEAGHPCEKKGLTKEQCIRLNAIHYLKSIGKIPASCSLYM
ncbi:hypothetical protein [Aureispira sp. CCB-E]|uniref:hypothetical protein n=1 Tax=Aureispira sp. CCB-E TaxID=3051121 RepID=UPI002868D64D|nr:hypothetical protein [Aureispira sp. CCB-E]WMX17477.1 hypothetical protein QP953_13935 [Aureispira sp. CCB-E]